jgi:hypothetical protein
VSDEQARSLDQDLDLDQANQISLYRFSLGQSAGLDGQPRRADEAALRGAIVSVAIKDSRSGAFDVIGSAVFIAPGLAVTAKHVLDTHFEAITVPAGLYWGTASAWLRYTPK